MARYMIDQRIDQPDGLKGFDVALSYTFRSDLSSEGDWVFTRPQPELVTKGRKRKRLNHGWSRIAALQRHGYQGQTRSSETIPKSVWAKRIRASSVVKS